MLLFLVRHGSALAEHEDPQRPLSPQGRREVTATAQYLKGTRLPIHAIFHSPKTRAVQTAVLIREIAAAPIQLSERPGMSPNDPVDELAYEVNGWEKNTMVVGHLPYLGKLASRLLTGDQEKSFLAFQPGAVAVLERASDRQSWYLAAFMIPQLSLYDEGAA